MDSAAPTTGPAGNLTTTHHPDTTGTSFVSTATAVSGQLEPVATTSDYPSAMSTTPTDGRKPTGSIGAAEEEEEEEEEEKKGRLRW